MEYHFAIRPEAETVKQYVINPQEKEIEKDDGGINL